jgi:hypothetical protein
VQEGKLTEHHSGHSLFGASSNSHTHYTLWRKWWTEQWTVTTDFDGKVTQTTPKMVGGVGLADCGSGMEGGWTPAYSRMIS